MSFPSRPDADTLFRASEILEDLGDKRSAFKCVEAGATCKHGPSQTKLGYMYAGGIGTKKDLKQAEYWYATAYRNGQAVAAFNLGMDKRDQGDRRSAIAWFRKAAAKNYGDAFVELAKLYSDRARTRRQAVDLLQRAVRLDSEHIFDSSRHEAEALLKKSC